MDRGREAFRGWNMHSGLSSLMPRVFMRRAIRDATPPASFEWVDQKCCCAAETPFWALATIYFCVIRLRSHLLARFSRKQIIFWFIWTISLLASPSVALKMMMQCVECFISRQDPRPPNPPSHKQPANLLPLKGPVLCIIHFISVF